MKKLDLSVLYRSFSLNRLSRIVVLRLFKYVTRRLLLDDSNSLASIMVRGLSVL